MCPLADSYVAVAAREACSVAELASARKFGKYNILDSGYIVEPTTLLAIFCQTWVARFLFSQAMIERLAFYISDSILIEPFNAILLHDSFVQKRTKD